MWDLRGANPLGRLSMRNILMFVATLLVACFAYILASAPIAAAADAEWNGAAIRYEGNLYTKVSDASKDDPRNLPEGSVIYTYSEPSSSTTGTQAQKVHIIYFAPKTNVSQAASAEYIVTNYIPPDKFTTTQTATTISLTPQSSGGSEATSCDSRFTFGLGWIVCPVTNFLANAMDWLYDILASFLEVKPVQTGQTDALYRAWSFMRNFANVAFVIAFMIIIYSQLTSFGLSNYGVKKTIPRLIAAAILVNISYWICALAIDASNILGYAVQDIFIAIRGSLLGSENNSWDVVSFASISSFILSGGTAAAVAGIGTWSIITGVGAGSLFLLLPILAGVLMAVLVALLVLAARQAIITVCVILAPLAFVAYLLPNTEKLFDRWRGLFTTMLVMFPIFSVIFGGSQLAGLAIIQNANSINTILLGMAVQVAPVVVTPLLVKFSGSLLGRIAGMVNNPNKGILDRTRKFADERAGQHKAKRQAHANPNSWMGRRIRNADFKRREREDWHKANQATADANWANSEEYSNIQQSVMKAAQVKELGELQAQRRYEAAKHSMHGAQELEMNLRASKLQLDVSKAKVEANWEELKAGNASSTITPAGLSVQGLADYMHTRNSLANSILADAQQTQIDGRRTHEAQEIQKDQYAEALASSETLRREAGGIAGQAGADSALTAAIASKRKSYADSVNEKAQLVKHFNLDSSDRQNLALGKDVVATRDGHTYTFRGDDDYAREAAIEDQLKTGSFGQIQEIIQESAQTIDGRQGKTHAYRTTISDAIPANGLPGKAAYFGSKAINDVAQGTFDVYESAIYQIKGGKIKDQALAAMDADAINLMLDPDLVSRVAPDDRDAFIKNRTAMQHSAYRIMHNDLLSNAASESARKVLEKFAVEPPSTP